MFSTVKSKEIRRAKRAGEEMWVFGINTREIQRYSLVESRSPAREARRENLGLFGAKSTENIGALSHPAREARRVFFGVFGAQKHKIVGG